MGKTGIQKTPFLITVALLVVFGGLSYILRYTTVTPDRPADFDQLPLEYKDWQGEEHIFSEVTYQVLQATSTTMRSYTHPQLDNSQPGLFIGYFEDQKYGAQIHSPRHCLPGGGWGIMSHTVTTLEINGRSLPVNRLIIGARNVRQLMYYWFETRSGIITNEFALKFDLFKNALLMRPTDAAFIRLTLFLPQGKTEQEGEQVLQNFLSDFLPKIENSLPFESR
jgi:EpsI family protein